MIAAAGGKEKVNTCRDVLGADQVIDYEVEDLYQRTMDLTDGRGVDVIYDPVGGDVFAESLRCIAPSLFS